jgi:putative methyltransferase (TIGR04325 family)
MLQDQSKTLATNPTSKPCPDNKDELSHSITHPLQAGSQPEKSVKQFLRYFVEKTPLISDFYRYYWIFPRNPNVYRGVFKTFAQAESSIPRKLLSGYNHTQAHRCEIEEVEQFNPRDYSLLDSLKIALSDSSYVFDLGGGIGDGYYAYRKMITFAENLHWTVCDVETAIEIGQKLANQHRVTGLSFTSDFKDADGADLLITCGALQYIEPSLADLIDSLTVKPKHILIHRIPVYDGETYVTLQNILTSVCPYKIQNRDALITSLKALGYQLINSWKDNRTCSIPFHPELFVDGYYGFYFRMESVFTNE